MVSVATIIGAILVLVVLVPVVGIGVGLLSYVGFWGSLRRAGREMGVRWWDAVGPFVLMSAIIALIAGAFVERQIGSAGRI